MSCRAKPRLPAGAVVGTLLAIMMTFVRWGLLSVLWSGGWLGAQVAGPSPLVAANAHEAMVPGAWIVTEGRAHAALQAGFPGTALAMYEEILANPALPADARPRLALARITAWMDRGDLEEAEQALRDYDGPRDSAYQLRAGLIALQARRLAAAKTALAASRPEELTAIDRGWWYFLQAGIADAENDTDRRNRAYEEASRLAVSNLQRARFALEQEQARLRSGRLNEAQLTALRDNMERFQGTRTGYDTLRTYAVALAGLGRAAEAQTLLQRQLAALPATERNVADQLRLVLGLIAGEGSSIGQQAFRQLLREAQRPDTQRLALAFLARAAKTPDDRERLRRELGELIGGATPHPISEDLLLVRAQTALVDKQYVPAEEDARALLERYPNSPQKTEALGVRLAVAWDSFRYSTAADIIAQLQVLKGEGRERSVLGVLLAEAWFRAGSEAEKRGADGKTYYRNAADAYDAALRVAPAVVPAGVLVFQQVLADIRADQLDLAAKQLDESAASLAGDPVSRWQAEWNLVKEMQVRGQTQAAYVRVEKLINPAGPVGNAEAGVPEELRIRLLWLRAKLAFDNGQPEVTRRQTDELLALLQASGTLEAGLRAEVTSTTQLLRAQALLAQASEAEGLEMLKKLRQDFPGTQAAQYSYLIEGGYLSGKGDMAGAQGVFIRFVDNPVYKNSEYAPLALYEAALNLERQGLDRQLREAYELLERLIKSYSKDGLVFYARLKQGDLMRKLNDFPTARQLYEDLVNNFAGHPDELIAQLALADTLFAQGANSVVNQESAAASFERLRDLPTAPVDLRVEAGYKWGVALAKHGQPAKAQGVFWSVVNDFLLNAAQAAQLGAKGRHWVARSLLELGQIHEDAGNLDEAQRAYRLIVDNKLGGTALAQDKLNRYLTGGGAKP